MFSAHFVGGACLVIFCWGVGWLGEWVMSERFFVARL